MALDDNWFSEIYPPMGSAFSLKLIRPLHEEKTDYQHIGIYATEKFGNLMVIDGCVMLTDLDNFLYHEMMSHPALFSHPKPKRVVIIGGGDCGTLREVLKHPGVEHAMQVEIDERVTRLAEQYFPALCESNNDPRAELYFGDGIRWMAEAADNSVDVIIIDSTDPVGPAEGLFGESFYRQAVRVLTQGGILVQQSESPLFHMHILKPMHAALRKCGFQDTTLLHFPQPVYPSGWWSATLAVKGAKAGTFREADARARTFETRYYNVDIHRAALAQPEFVRRELFGEK